MIKNGMRLIHRGEGLIEDYLKLLKLRVNALSKVLHKPSRRVNDIVLQRLSKFELKLKSWRWFREARIPVEHPPVGTV